MTDQEFQQRTSRLCEKMVEEKIELAIITDESSVYYFSGYYYYLHMDFGRPTALLIWQDGRCELMTADMEMEMTAQMSWIENITPWRDGIDGEWRGPLDRVIERTGTANIGLEIHSTPSIVRDYLNTKISGNKVSDISELIATIRMIKSPAEIDIARQAGKVANALMAGAYEAMGEGVPEYEIALATMVAGTRKAAELLESHNDDPLMSPMMHFLQIMASGKDITMPHHRASTRRLQRGEPVFMCFCGMTNFRHFKLGFDRTFWIGEIAEPAQQQVYQTAVDSQKAALKQVRAGITAEEVHMAYADVIQSAGYDFPFRCGRATGFSFLEKPQLTHGDHTVLQPGMVFAVDGSVSAPEYNFRAQVGDSLVVTEDGYEMLTNYSKNVADLIA